MVTWLSADVPQDAGKLAQRSILKGLCRPEDTKCISFLSKHSKSSNSTTSHPHTVPHPPLLTADRTFFFYPLQKLFLYLINKLIFGALEVISDVFCRRTRWWIRMEVSCSISCYLSGVINYQAKYTFCSQKLILWEKNNIVPSVAHYSLKPKMAEQSRDEGSSIVVVQALTAARSWARNDICSWFADFKYNCFS